MYKGTLEIGGDINSEISLGTDDELLVILNGNQIRYLIYQEVLEELRIITIPEKFI